MKNLDEAKIEWDKYGDKSIEFILTESKELLRESIISYRATLNRSWGTFGFCAVIMSYWFNKLIGSSFGIDRIFYSLMVVAVGVGIYYILKNLRPMNLTFSGTKPVNLLTDYFYGVSGLEQLKRYYIVEIINNDKAIAANLEGNKCRLQTLKFVINYIAIIHIIYFVVFIIYQDFPLLF